jgi:hypothetical protein
MQVLYHWLWKWYKGTLLVDENIGVVVARWLRSPEHEVFSGDRRYRAFRKVA